MRHRLEYYVAAAGFTAAEAAGELGLTLEEWQALVAGRRPANAAEVARLVGQPESALWDSQDRPRLAKGWYADDERDPTPPILTMLEQARKAKPTARLTLKLRTAANLSITALDELERGRLLLSEHQAEAVAGVLGKPLESLFSRVGAALPAVQS